MKVSTSKSPISIPPACRRSRSAGMIHAHRGKGAKDRYVPLPQSTLSLLHHYWLTHRHPALLFLAIGRTRQGGRQAQTPLAKTTAEAGLRSLSSGQVCRRYSQIDGRRSYPPTFIGHPFEAGVNLRVIQRYLGHSQLETTMVYLHLTQKGREDASQLINQVMGGLDHDHHLSGSSQS